MHSLVAYELVKVLLNFGLTPKIHEDLNDWSPNLYCLFSYLGAKQWDASKKERAHELLSILFDKNLHNSYFGKLLFGSKEKFAKKTNTILPLVILTWLRLLQEHFYEIVDTNENGDWNEHGKYCPGKASKVEKELPLDYMHMIRANNETVTKITSLDMIKPDNKHHKNVIKSLEEWAAKILCRDSDCIQDLANADNETKLRFERTKAHGRKQYSMMKKNYKPNQQQSGGNAEVVKDFSIERQQHKSPHQLVCT